MRGTARLVVIVSAEADNPHRIPIPHILSVAHIMRLLRHIFLGHDLSLLSVNRMVIIFRVLFTMRFFLFVLQLMNLVIILIIPWS